MSGLTLGLANGSQLQGIGEWREGEVGVFILIFFPGRLVLTAVHHYHASPFHCPGSVLLPLQRSSPWGDEALPTLSPAPRLSSVLSSHCPTVFVKLSSITQYECSICFLLGPQVMQRKQWNRDSILCLGTKYVHWEVLWETSSAHWYHFPWVAKLSSSPALWETQIMPLPILHSLLFQMRPQWGATRRPLKSALDPLPHLGRGKASASPCPHITSSSSFCTASPCFPVLWALHPLGTASPQSLRPGQSRAEAPSSAPVVCRVPSRPHTQRYFGYLSCCQSPVDAVIPQFGHFCSTTVNLHPELIGYRFYFFH